MRTSVAVPPRISEVVQEYEAKRDGGDVVRVGSDGVEEVLKSYRGAEAEADAFNQAVSNVEVLSTLGSAYPGPLFTGLTPKINSDQIKKRLLLAAWREVYRGLNVAEIATAKDKASIDLFLAAPPEFTLDEIREAFGSYFIDPRGHVLRGLAEVFADLDPSFRSHEKMKIGVKGLPKRVIVENVGGRYSYDSHGTRQLRDVIRAYLALLSLPNIESSELESLKDEARTEGEADWPGGRLKVYKNGNGHLYFSPEALKEVNLGLAEYYGEVLPDSPEGEAEDLKRRPSTAVSKDLQFYWTPKEVVRAMLDRSEPYNGAKILEPSCGDGRIMEGVREYVSRHKIEDVKMAGIEVDPGRAEEARAKGFSVACTNFLEVDLSEEARFNIILMNPPFYGRHYLKHIKKAIELLKPGGRLTAILPATAYYDHGELPGRQYDPSNRYAHRDVWMDLPMGSFREAGTNVATGIWTYWKARQ